jgi:hypothetical protein
MFVHHPPFTHTHTRTHNIFLSVIKLFQDPKNFAETTWKAACKVVLWTTIRPAWRSAAYEETALHWIEREKGPPLTKWCSVLEAERS